MLSPPHRHRVIATTTIITTCITSVAFVAVAVIAIIASPSFTIFVIVTIFGIVVGTVTAIAIAGIARTAIATAAIPDTTPSPSSVASEDPAARQQLLARCAESAAFVKARQAGGPQELARRGFVQYVLEPLRAVCAAATRQKVAR